MTGYWTFTRIGGAPRTGAATPPRFGESMARAWRAVGAAMRAAASRRDLAELDDRMLKDLGISRAQAAFEASRHPWEISPTGAKRR